MGLSTTGTQYAQGSYVVNTNGTAAITLSTVITACSTVGSWSGYQVRAYVTPIG
jgi:membrane-bound inhibitor of C-type lysozyme